MATAEQLIEMYVQADERLRALIQTLESGSVTQRRKEQLLRQIEQMIAELTETAGEQMANLLGSSYRSGAVAALEQMAAAGIAAETVEESLKPLIHQEAAQAIMDETFYSILDASEHMSADAKRRIEEIARTANQRSLLEGVSRRQATKQAVADLNSQGITGIITKSGSRVPADKYMAGVVQYGLRKAHVTGTENMAIQHDQDLVYINFVGITCEFCAKYQGRVYSISGADQRFPKLELRPPYHAHCIHSMSVWIEEYMPAEEVERMLATSNRPFVDNRTEHHIRRYNERARLVAAKNETRKQWMRYKAVLPDMPNLKQFASQKSRGTAAYHEWQESFRKVNSKIKEQGG